MVANLCFVVPDPRSWVSSGDSPTPPIFPDDLTTSAAEANMITPSLPIDHDRYLTFSHKVGGVHTIQYPNLFRFDDAELLKKYSNTGILKRGA